jgi:hypothetical protein
MEDNASDFVSVDVDSAFEFLHNVDMDSVAAIAEVHTISAFRVKLSSVGECS